THNSRSGVSHYMATDEDDAIEYVKSMLSYLPSNNMDATPTFDAEADLEINDDDRAMDTLVPDSANLAYDMNDVIAHIV
ncbi:methylmalonyl-CoA carboxyltransferase, partial [Xanthomonas citri pv. citri]|nr:methylmalonyl-CoA carboxyltransferase [Xanthomonas citri pv. citri]